MRLVRAGKGTMSPDANGGGQGNTVGGSTWEPTRWDRRRNEYELGPCRGDGRLVETGGSSAG